MEESPKKPDITFDIREDPAFPLPPVLDRNGVIIYSNRWELSGLNSREYSAIHLKVPDSGVEWIDEMIRKNLRNDLAKQAMRALLEKEKDEPFNYESLAQNAYDVASAMLTELLCPCHAHTTRNQEYYKCESRGKKE